MLISIISDYTPGHKQEGVKQQLGDSSDFCPLTSVSPETLFFSLGCLFLRRGAVSSEGGVGMLWQEDEARPEVKGAGNSSEGRQ